MTLNRLPVVLFLCFCFGSTGIANESIRLHFTVMKDGATIASPEMSVEAGTTGSIDLDAVGRIAFTPATRTSESIAVTFEIKSAGKNLQPILVVAKNQPGSLSWPSDTGSGSFNLSVSWVR